MMPNYRKAYAPQADEDADSILEWLASHQAGDSAIRWFLAFEDAIVCFANFPQRCPLAPENQNSPSRCARCFTVIKPHVYRILFTQETDTVYILHIRHARRQALIEH